MGFGNEHDFILEFSTLLKNKKLESPRIILELSVENK